MYYKNGYESRYIHVYTVPGITWKTEIFGKAEVPGIQVVIAH